MVFHKFPAPNTNTIKIESETINITEYNTDYLTENITDNIISDRNNSMSDEVKKLLEQNKNAFIVVGSAHVIGEDGIVNNLKDDYKIIFLGKLSLDNLKAYLLASDIFAFPSITKNEAFGMALAEAMYCNTPAVTFTIPGSGVNWVNLDGVTGIEAPNGDVEAFAGAIDKLLTDDNLAKTYAEAAHQRVAERFTVGKMMEEMEKCYKELSNHAG